MEKLTYTATAADRLRHLFKFYPDVFNCLRIILLEIKEDANAGCDLGELTRLTDESVVARRVLESIQEAGTLPDGHRVHFIEIPDRAMPPPNIAIACFAPRRRLIYAVGYIPRKRKTIEP